jgi:hypothetical protein
LGALRGEPASPKRTWLILCRAVGKLFVVPGAPPVPVKTGSTTASNQPCSSEQMTRMYAGGRGQAKHRLGPTGTGAPSSAPRPPTGTFLRPYLPQPHRYEPQSAGVTPAPLPAPSFAPTYPSPTGTSRSPPV